MANLMPSNSLRLLSLDGGGVRGLSALQVLNQLMITINPDAPPKPCDYFDLIGGTSTGGLIAIMLGRLRMSVPQCIDAYILLSDRVFQKQRHRVKLSRFIDIGVQGRFDHKDLEQAIKDIIRQCGGHEDDLLDDPLTDNNCKTFVCAQSQDTSETVRFRSYKTARAPRRDIKIWEAARATTAATTFFDPVELQSGERFVDGAIGANNPVNEVWSEAQDIWRPQESSIKCVVSIGTGVPSLIAFNDDSLKAVGQMLIKYATQTERTAEEFRRDKQNLAIEGRYYRFNVVRGLENIGLENSKQKGAIIAATSRYLESQEAFEKIVACASALQKIEGGLVSSMQDTEAMKTHIVCRPRKNQIDFPSTIKMTWCKSVFYRADHSHGHEQAEPYATMDWLFDNTTFKEWQDGNNADSALLTLKGGPATGKSVLMEEALARCQSQGTISISYYFGMKRCGKQEDESSLFRTSTEGFLCSILIQLLEKLNLMTWPAFEQWDAAFRQNPGTPPWTIKELEDTILEVMTEGPRKPFHIFFFIDGIDKCTDDPITFLNFIKNLLQKSSTAGLMLRVCMSRRHLPMYDASEPKGQVLVMEDNNRPSIRDFVKTKLDEIESKPLRLLVFSRIMDRQPQEFLWPTVVIKQVLKRVSSTSHDGLLRVVDELPDSHADIYRQLLATGNPLEQTETRQLIYMMYATRRPITVDEFRQALAFVNEPTFSNIESWEQSTHRFQPGEHFENYLRRESRGLIGTYRSPDDARTVRFVHDSVSVFLRERNVASPEVGCAWDKRCHLVLFQACLHALDFCSLDGEDDFPFVLYATENWLYHARKADALLDEIKDLPYFLEDCSGSKAGRVINRVVRSGQRLGVRGSHLLQGFEPEEEDIRDGIQHLEIEGNGNELAEPVTNNSTRRSEHPEETSVDSGSEDVSDDGVNAESLLVVLATLGCTFLLCRHLVHCDTCQEHCTSLASGIYHKALQNAVITNWPETAQWLLQTYSQEGDINFLSAGSTLLYKACYFHQKEVVRFMLDNGADPCTRSETKYEYPLHCAIELGHAEIIRELLKGSSGIIANTYAIKRERDGNTPLHTAIQNRQPSKRKLEALRLVLKLAPKDSAILAVENHAGESPASLARELRKSKDKWDKIVAEELDDFSRRLNKKKVPR